MKYAKLDERIIDGLAEVMEQIDRPEIARLRLKMAENVKDPSLEDTADNLIKLWARERAIAREAGHPILTAHRVDCRLPPTASKVWRSSPRWVYPLYERIISFPAMKQLLSITKAREKRELPYIGVRLN